MLTDLVVEACSTQGTGAYSLGGASGSYKTWRSKVANGSTVFYVAKTTNGAKIEKGYGVLAYGTPDTLTRNVIESSNVNAAINWQSTDTYVVYCAPVLDVIAPLMFGTGFTARPSWAQAGLRWIDWAAGIGTRLIDKLFNGTADVELGRYEAIPAIYVPSPRRYWVDKGANSYTATVDDVGKVLEFDTSTATRTLTLPASSAIAHGHTLYALGSGPYPVTLAPNGSDAITALSLPPGRAIRIEWDGAKSKWRVEAPAYAGVRQTVCSGPVDSSGLPSFLPATSGALSITTQNVTAAAQLIASGALGWSAPGNPIDLVGASAVNISWTGLTNNATNYLYGTIAEGVITPVPTTLAPVYQWGGTPSTTNGQITFNIAEMKAYLGNGTTAVVTALVVFGEATTVAGAVTAAVAYAYNGRYESAFTATLPAAATFTSANHNLGVKPKEAHFIIENTTTELGYAVGDQIIDPTGNNGAQSYSAVTFNAKTIGFQTASATAFNVPTRTDASGVIAALTLASWKYKFSVDRGW